MLIALGDRSTSFALLAVQLHHYHHMKTTSSSSFPSLVNLFEPCTTVLHII